MAHMPIEAASDADIAELDARINAFNINTTGILDGHDLSIILRTAGGEIYAGLHGFTWGGYCEIKLLWVAENHRGSGIGSRLLVSAEHEAKARRCGRIILTTHSFQAPEFYEHHGFRRVSTIADCPRGHAHITLVKQL